MANAPVYYTIAQVRYNPILSLDTYIPGLQEAFRKMGYSDYGKLVSVAFNMAPTRNNELPLQSPPVDRIERHVFSNMERSRGFVLDQGALSFQATDHDVFDTTSRELLHGLSMLDKAVSLSYSERIGVRYLDAVVPRGGESVRHYLVPEVLGLYDKLNGNLSHSFSETVTASRAGSLTSRVVIQHGTLGFPPDLQPIGLNLAPRFAQINGDHAILDTDGVWEVRESFNLEKIGERLLQLHDEIIRSFQVTVSEHALSVWQ